MKVYAIGLDTMSSIVLSLGQGIREIAPWLEQDQSWTQAAAVTHVRHGVDFQGLMMLNL